MTNSVTILKEKFNLSLGLPFKELLPESVIELALKELNIKYKQRLFTPLVTLWAFLSQVLDTDKTCHNTVSRVISYLVGEGVELPSTDTSAYCQARSRLPEKLLEKLFTQAARSLEEKVTREHLWCGRHVLLIDGSTVSMPDTVENQKAYPQPKTQKAGCRFPMAKIVVLFSLATGSATALALDVLNTHELRLARKLYQFLNRGDVLLGDRGFCTYPELVFLQKINCDAVLRKHQARKNPMGKGTIVGDCDRLVTWYKPTICPLRLSLEEFAEEPKTLTVREISYCIVVPGFRTQRVSLITTLLDIKKYSTLDLVELYGKRWEVELDLKHLKTTLGMDVLRCKTPSLVRKEIYVCLLAYNLLRSLMWEAATTNSALPLRLSLQGTRHHFHNFIPKFFTANPAQRHHLYRTLLKVIVHKQVPHRPGRSEPRVHKRRPKAYPFMTKPRHELRKHLQTA